MRSTSSGSFLQNVTFCGGVVGLTLTAFTSPSFAQPSCGLNVPFEKGAIQRFAQNNNYAQIDPTIGHLFENAALASEGPNGIPFPPNNRRVRVPGVGNAVPDIYLTTVVTITDFFGRIIYQSQPYADSFIGDAKAINPNGSVTDDDGQIAVYIAALAQSPAGVAPPTFVTFPNGSIISVRPTPILFFPTTAFVGVTSSILDDATAKRVAVAQAISCQQLLFAGDTMYISDPDTLNPGVFDPPNSGSDKLSNPPFLLGAGTSVPINVHAVDITNITPTSAPVGTVVTINGVNFDGNPASGEKVTVKVNGVEARQVDRISNTQVQFRVPHRTPRGPAEVQVTVGSVTKIWHDFTVTP
jgi:hypothetical protein